MTEESAGFVPFYGGYETVSLGVMVWRHNPRLTRTEEEQYKFNCKHHPDFQIVKTMPIEELTGKVTYKQVGKKKFNFCEWVSSLFK